MSKTDKILYRLLPNVETHDEPSVEEDIDFNPAKHSLMLKKLQFGDHKDQKVQDVQRSEVGGALRTHGMSSANKFSLTDLLSTKTKKSVKLKRDVSRLISSRKPSEPPFSQNQRKKTERQAVYRRARDEVSQWQSTVDSNRKAEQMSFPLEYVSEGSERRDLYNSMKCEGSMEREIKGVLDSTDDTVKSALSLTERERRVIEALDVETARKMQNELARLRSLEARYEKKARWAKKIKSKSYRRMNRNERRREQDKSLERLREEDPEEFARRVLSLRTDRMRERMTLKHSASTKYLHNQKMYSKYNESARDLVNEMHAKKRKLTDKVAIGEEDDELAERNRCLDESNVYKPLFEPQQDSGEEWQAEEEDLANTVVEPAAPETVERGESRGRPVAVDFSLGCSEERTEPVISYNDIAGVTHGGDFEEDFAEEKDRVQEEEAGKDLDLFLPGWNLWAGPSIKPAAERKEQYTRKATEVKRRDRGLGNVIISEKQPTLQAHRVKHVPFPFLSVEQFESSLRTPIDRTFIPESAFRKMIRPRVVTKAGRIIRPISRKATLHNKL